MGWSYVPEPDRRRGGSRSLPSPMDGLCPPAIPFCRSGFAPSEHVVPPVSGREHETSSK